MSYEVISPPPVDTDSGVRTRRTIDPASVHGTLGRHLLVDGFDLVVDLRRSRGSVIVDAIGGKRYIDFFTFFASMPVGFNHPALLSEQFQDELLHAAIAKPSCSDAYTVEMAEFVDTFSRVGIPSYLPHAFFIEGGALAVENALKTAFDWKVRRNFSRGHAEEKGFRIAHFVAAFHGRSGYTMTMTNTDPRKVAYYPKFPGWPRIVNPAAVFPLVGENLDRTVALEQQAVQQLKQAFIEHPDEIAAIIIEPIQGEGGDNHFRTEFFRELRVLADENDALLIFDEVQTGVGMTGKFWAHEHFVRPDILVFGKKMQVCGILAGPRVDEVPDNVFHVSSRINSTWGGNLTDMVRSRKYLEIIEQERLVARAAATGAYLLSRLEDFAREYPELLSNARGRGLFCAIDIGTAELRDAIRTKAYEQGLVLLGAGPRAIRFRPALDIDMETLDEGLAILGSVFAQHAARPSHP